MLGCRSTPMKGRQLRMLIQAAALGGSPREFDDDTSAEVEIRRPEIRVGDTLVRSLNLGKWPRALIPGFLQALMASGARMGHLHPSGAHPLRPGGPHSRMAEGAIRIGRSRCPCIEGSRCRREAEIALEDVRRLRDDVQRGRERLFHSSLSITLHGRHSAELKDMTQGVRAHFAATLGKLDTLAFRQREGLLSALPINLNALGSLADAGHLFARAPLSVFASPDLDTRSGTLYGIDLRSSSPIVYDPFDGTHLNANTAVLARSRQRQIVRHQTRASFAASAGEVTAYVIRSRGRIRRHGACCGGPRCCRRVCRGRA